jgi:peptidoglycan hydrolase CwlO-like protein
MTVIEELMATVRAQQHTIEVLTIKLEETNAKLDKANARIAELEEQLHKDSGH